jgi:hypothetical protein
MTDSPTLAPAAAEELPPGLVCRVCQGTRWKVTHTREAFAAIRRFRTCVGCAHRIRTRETIEAESHPDRDAR